MDWDLKLPPWELAELELNAEPHNMGAMTGRPDCSVDLKLGGLGDFGPAGKWVDPTGDLAMASSSSSGSSKRARPPGGGGTQNVSCLVEGCRSDLSNGRDYHRRHKVCEIHSKTPVVVVGGQEQRFCQQCSRFHLLAEFDEVKRSCRKRLDGHNRRRRKHQPESISSGSLFPNHQGASFSSYPQVFPSSAPNSNWSGVVKAEEDALYIHHQRHLQRSFHSYKEGTLGLSLPKTITPMESSSSRMFPEGLTQVLGSDCALSLLSSPAKPSGINIGQMTPVDRNPMGQQLVPTLQYSGFSRYTHSQASDNDADAQCQGLFRVGGEGLPYSWQ